MKLIIDIDETTYDSLKQIYNPEIGMLSPTYEAVVNGAPLPKGHGRLIDADELTKQLETVANDEWNKQVGASKGLEEAIDIVEDEPTIIEADTAESEDNG